MRLVRAYTYRITGRWRDAPCVFVLGTGRSGTHTLADLLGQAANIQAFHEPAPRLIRERLEAYWHVWDEPQKYAGIFQSARARMIASALARKSTYAETSARLTFFAPAIIQLLPRARFIHIHRHPADVVRSGMRRGWYADGKADAVRLRPARTAEIHRIWTSLTPFEKNCWYWDACHRFALRVRESWPRRVFALPSEKLFRRDAGVIAEVFEWLDAPAPPSTAVSASLLANANAQQKGTFPKPDDWNARLWSTLRRFAGHTMELLGYGSASDCASRRTA